MQESHTDMLNRLFPYNMQVGADAAALCSSDYDSDDEDTAVGANKRSHSSYPSNHPSYPSNHTSYPNNHPSYPSNQWESQQTEQFLPRENYKLTDVTKYLIQEKSPSISKKELQNVVAPPTEHCYSHDKNMLKASNKDVNAGDRHSTHPPPKHNPQDDISKENPKQIQSSNSYDSENRAMGSNEYRVLEVFGEHNAPNHAYNSDPNTCSCSSTKDNTKSSSSGLSSERTNYNRKHHVDSDENQYLDMSCAHPLPDTSHSYTTNLQNTCHEKGPKSKNTAHEQIHRIMYYGDDTSSLTYSPKPCTKYNKLDVKPTNSKQPPVQNHYQSYKHNGTDNNIKKKTNKSSPYAGLRSYQQLPYGIGSDGKSHETYAVLAMVVMACFNIPFGLLGL